MSEETKWMYEEAQIAFNAGDYAKAYAVLLNLLELEPSNGPAHELLIKTCKKSQNPDAELRAAQDLYAQDPTPNNRKKLALTLKHLNRSNAAKQDFKAVLMDRPDDCDALAGLGLVCTELEDYEEAVELLEKSVMMRPGDSDVLFALGKCYLYTRRLEQAAGIFEQMRISYSGQEGVRAMLGRTRELSARGGEAYALYVEEVKLHPSYPEGVKYLAEYYGSTGDKKSMEEVYAEGIEAAKKRPGDLINMGTMLIRQDRMLQGRQVLYYAAELAEQKGYNSSLLYNNLGVAFLDADKGIAMEHFQRSLSIFKSHHNPMHNMGLALAGEGRYKEAEKWLLRALELEPGWHITLSVLGWVYFGLGDVQKGRDMYLRAIERKPQKARYRAELGFYLYREGLLEEAKSRALEALKIKSDNSDALFTMAMCCMDEMDLEQARSYADRAANAGDHSYNHLKLKQRLKKLEAAVRDGRALDLKAHLEGGVPPTDYLFDGARFGEGVCDAVMKLHGILTRGIRGRVTYSVYLRDRMGRFGCAVEVAAQRMNALTGIADKSTFMVVRFSSPKEGEAEKTAKMVAGKMGKFSQ